MSSNRRPWYPWYPKDFGVDEKVRSLSDDAELLYRRILDIMWQANDLQMLNSCTRISNAIARGWSESRFEKAWNEIQVPGFELLKTSKCGGYVYSERLCREALKIGNISEKRRKAALKKYHKNECTANAQQMECHTDTHTDIKKKSIKKKKKSPLPEDPHLSDAHIKYAVTKGMPLETIKDEFEGFCIYHRQKGSMMVDWYAAWQTWVRNHFKFRKDKNQKTEWQRNQESSRKQALAYREIKDRERILRDGPDTSVGDDRVHQIEFKQADSDK